MAGGRVGGVEHAERVNAAAALVGAGVPAAQAARVLAERLAVSVRQARRYVDQAAASGPVAVPDESVVFTVRLPAALAGRVRAHARESGSTISAVVARALTEFLARGRRQHRRR
jgi:hypothetical protein